MSDGSLHLVKYLKWTVFLTATALVVYGCLLILSPFLNVLAWSAVLATAFYPVHQRLVRLTRRPSLSAFLSSVLVVVVIVMPLLFITAVAIDQLLSLRDFLQQRAAEGRGFDLAMFEPIRQVADWLNRRLGIDLTEISTWLSENANELGRLVAEYSLNIAANVTNVAVSFVFTVFAMFLLFRDGTRIVAAVADLMPFDRETNETMLRHIGDVIYGSLYGVAVIALLQGAATGFMFWALGIPSAALWGAVTALTSVLPLVGAAAVWIPGAVYLALNGEWTQTIILVLWGTFVISAVDNFFRPKLVGGRVGLNEFVMFFALLGGLQMFGVLGIVLGPLLFSIAASILKVLSNPAVTVDKDGGEIHAN